MGSRAASEARQEPSLAAASVARQGREASERKGWDPVMLPENKISASYAAIL